jgi:metal-responsive CopG/Arc/MetJ family transcriptional regulator
MRTTVDLPDSLFRELKSTAARRGKSLKELIRTAVESEIRKTERRAGRRVKFPLLSSKQPGSLNLTNAEIDKLLT